MESTHARHRRHLRRAARSLAESLALHVEERELARNNQGPGKLYLATSDGSVVIMGHAHEWRENGGVPHGKFEAALRSVELLRRFAPHARKLLVLSESLHPATGEPLADRFVRQHRHRLDGVEVHELRASGAIRPVLPKE